MELSFSGSSVTCPWCVFPELPILVLKLSKLILVPVEERLVLLHERVALFRDGSDKEYAQRQGGEKEEPTRERKLGIMHTGNTLSG